ncbi:MAG TPA: YciI family protein [Burkholderiales bacterium]|nr:YciI family protein [Burkholderiales bacterium]
MQYLFMCCFEEQAWNAIPGEARDRVMRDYGAWVDALTAQGQYLAGGKLKPSAASTTVRVKNGKPFITDGPYAETREQLGGYHVVECQDLDEALALAARIPTLPVGGTIEVRPLDFSTTPGAAFNERERTAAMG